ALSAAREISNESSRASVLIALAENLPPELIGEALSAAREITDESSRASVLSALAENLPPELIGKALSAAREITDESTRADVLIALAKRQPELMGEALSAAREITEESTRASVLSALAENLPPGMINKVLKSSQFNVPYDYAVAISGAIRNPNFKIVSLSDWTSLLKIISFRDRKEFFYDYAELASHLSRYIDEETTTKAVVALRAVCHQWP
ncbi:MAG: hypothetical protein AB4040_06760, partial [Synechococcus sp.]